MERFQTYELPKIQLDSTGETVYWIPPAMIHPKLRQPIIDHQSMGYVRYIKFSNPQYYATPNLAEEIEQNSSPENDGLSPFLPM